jgi:hypothetical protein
MNTTAFLTVLAALIIEAQQVAGQTFGMQATLWSVADHSAVEFIFHTV